MRWLVAGTMLKLVDEEDIGEISRESNGRAPSVKWSSLGSVLTLVFGSSVRSISIFMPLGMRGSSSELASRPRTLEVTFGKAVEASRPMVSDGSWFAEAVL